MRVIRDILKVTKLRMIHNILKVKVDWVFQGVILGGIFSSYFFLILPLADTCKYIDRTGDLKLCLKENIKREMTKAII